MPSIFPNELASVKLAGQPDAVLKAEEPMWDPEFGYSIRQVWTGSKAAVLTKLLAFSSAGYRASTSKITGGSWQCVGNVPISGEQPTIKFSIDAEWAQVGIFADPVVAAEAKTWVSPDGKTSGPGNYKKLLTDAADNGDNSNPISPVGTYPISDKVFRFLQRGGEDYEIRRLIFKRKRTMPIEWAQPVILDGLEKIYTTASLVALLGIPSGIAMQLPGWAGAPGFPPNPYPPTTPDDCAWAWKARLDTSDFIPSLNKVEEEKDFVFAAWITWGSYTLV